MSRYMIDKLLWQIDRDDAALEAYTDDPVGFVDAWERSASLPQPPYPDGGWLTGEEREAFEGADAAALYELGANPYLLWHFVRAVMLVPGMDPGELSDRFKKSISPRPAPDHTTWLG